jgi:hypothetical protein
MPHVERVSQLGETLWEQHEQGEVNHKSFVALAVVFLSPSQAYREQ